MLTISAFGYFPPMENFISPAGNEDAKISILYFEEDKVCALAENTQGYLKKNQQNSLSLFFKNKLVNLKCPPWFLDNYPHSPGTSAQAFIAINDRELFYGQFNEGDDFDVLFYDASLNKNFCIGKGTFQHIIHQHLLGWSTTDFVSRYYKRLTPMINLDAVLIELNDGLSRLNFVEKISVSCSKNRDEIICVNLSPCIKTISKYQLKDLLSIVSFIKLENDRYNIDYEVYLDTNLKANYSNIELQIALWNSFEFITIKIFL